MIFLVEPNVGVRTNDNDLADPEEVLQVFGSAQSFLHFGLQVRPSMILDSH